MLTAPSLNQAQGFLTALDENAESWTFQTFSDTASGGRRLNRQLHGAFESHADALARLNSDGAGVFVTVNQTNGQGRKKADIERVRALFVDLDGAPLAPVQSSETPPHIVVETSPRRFHAYWRVSDCSPDDCEPALKHLINRYAGDAHCSDRSRVLRLPGFFHRKRDPFMVNVIDAQPGEYRLSELVPDLQKNQKMTYVTSVSSDSSVSSVGVRVEKFLPSENGQRNKYLFALARHAKAVMPEATEAQLRGLVRQWFELAKPVIGTQEFVTSWGDFKRAWEAVKFPAGEALAPVLAALKEPEPIPDELQERGFCDRDWLLVRLCRELQLLAGDEPFFIGARKAGEILDMHYTDASALLRALVADGIIQLVSRGSGSKASRYRFTWRGEE